MFRYSLSESCELVLTSGDLTKANVEAVVNAANEAMLGGGGVDGAIHRAAGPELLEACKAVEPVRPRVRCPVGKARVTPGFQLPAKYVIHTVGPMFHFADDPETLLAEAFTSSLHLARHLKLKTIAFPAISCGAYAFPVKLAARIALRVCLEQTEGFEEIRFVLFEERTLDAWKLAAEKMNLPPL